MKKIAQGTILFHKKRKEYVVICHSQWIGTLERKSESQNKHTKIVNDFLYTCAYLSDPDKIRNYYGSRVRDGELEVVEYPSKEMYMLAVEVMVAQVNAA